MFKARALQIQVVDPAKGETTPPSLIALPSPDDAAEYAAIAAYWAKRTAFVGTALYTFNKVVNTGCEIVLITARAKIQ